MPGGLLPGGLQFRLARSSDLADIVRLLADDVLGAARENVQSPLPPSYQRAFDAIARDPNQELVVACIGERIVGTLQLTFIPCLTYQGSWRAQVESVRVDSSLRSRGVGRAMMDHVIERSRSRGCRLLQLTTNKSRADARRFYERLGFVASHEGMKLQLPQAG